MVQTVDETDIRSRSLDEIRDRLQADWTREQALSAAQEQAKTVMTDVNQSLANQPASKSFQRSGSGLDHEAAGLIAQATFSQAVGEAQLVETGEHYRCSYRHCAAQRRQSDMSETIQAGRTAC